MCETAMGTKINAQTNVNSEYVKAVHDIIQTILNRAFNIFKHPDFLFILTSDYQRQQKAIKILHEYAISVIESRREKLNKNNQNFNDVDDDIGVKKKMPFLDLLLQTTLNGVALSNKDIREEVDTFMFAGHETITSAVSFTVYCLSINSEIQENVIKEREIFENDPSRKTTFNDLNAMKYLEMVIKETLRLYPTAPLFAKLVTEDIKYKNYVIKKGLEIGMFVYTLHRNAEIYPDPERFDPLRFTPEMQAKRHPYAYLPFSGGIRNCVGQKFAMLEMKSVLSKLFRKYVFLPAKNYSFQLKSGFTLDAIDGIQVAIKKRKW